MSSGGQVTGGSGTAGGNTGGTINATNITPFINTTSNDSSYVYLYGNLHSHSSYSDGNQDDKTKTPSDDYAYALNSPGFDFLGISEHNHSTAGLNISNYKLGYQQAEAANGQTNSAGNPFITLYGMEWGVISGGGHVVTYGFGDQLVGWEMGNYDIYVAKSDYASLFKLVTQTPGTFCTLAHPQSGDYSNLASVYNSTGDSAVVGVALESGPATGTQAASPTYPTSLSYLSVYRQMLSNGYRVGADFDQDNHNMTFGTINNNRTVVLARSRTREGVMDAYRNMRFYGSNDYNAKVNFTAGTYTMGSSIVSADQQTLTVTHSDPDGENAVAIQLWGGKVGDPVPTSPLATSATNSLTFTTNQTGNMTWYYYAVVTQADGNKMITSPIWLTSYVPYTLPVNFVSFYGNAGINQNVLNWETATETNSSKFLVERSGGNAQMSVIGTVEAAGNSTGHKKYAFVDASPLQGQNLYRLKEVDQNGKVTYTPFVRIFSNQIQLVNVYPNPASNELMVRISAPAQEMKSVSLVDAAGNMVYKADQTTSMFRIDTSKFPKGTYVLSVQSPTVKSAQKVVLK